jgi:hypothetical protein
MKTVPRSSGCLAVGIPLSLQTVGERPPLRGGPAASAVTLGVLEQMLVKEGVFFRGQAFLVFGESRPLQNG